MTPAGRGSGQALLASPGPHLCLTLLSLTPCAIGLRVPCPAGRPAPHFTRLASDRALPRRPGRFTCLSRLQVRVNLKRPGSSCEETEFGEEPRKPEVSGLFIRVGKLSSVRHRADLRTGHQTPHCNRAAVRKASLRFRHCSITNESWKMET